MRRAGPDGRRAPVRHFRGLLACRLPQLLNDRSLEERHDQQATTCEHAPVEGEARRIFPSSGSDRIGHARRPSGPACAGPPSTGCAPTTKRSPAAGSDALDLGVERLQDDAMRRALDGVERPVWRNGEQVGTVQQYDNRLLQFLLQVPPTRDLRRPQRRRGRRRCPSISPSASPPASAASTPTSPAVAPRRSSVARGTETRKLTSSASG